MGVLGGCVALTTRTGRCTDHEPALLFAVESASVTVNDISAGIDGERSSRGPRLSRLSPTLRPCRRRPGTRRPPGADEGHRGCRPGREAGPRRQLGTNERVAVANLPCRRRLHCQLSCLPGRKDLIQRVLPCSFGLGWRHGGEACWSADGLVAATKHLPRPEDVARLAGSIR